MSDKLKHPVFLTAPTDSVPAHTFQFDADEEVLICAENVGKRFCKNLKRSLAYGLMDGLRDFLPIHGRSREPDCGVKLRRDEFWANRGINFELRRGECLGLIGHNGAGKTTLLKMLNGLIKPDEGRIKIRGRVGALIALNAGFNPVLTGRENIYISGAVHGLTRRQIDSKFDDIVAFAELQDFINTPVQNYSSGMQVRLGFAVATALEPDVLLVDEVLAVGDSRFRAKCLRRISELCEKAAVILVAHNSKQLARVCTKAILLERGQVKIAADPSEVILSYESAAVSSRRMVKHFQSVEIGDVSFRFVNPCCRFGENLQGLLRVVANHTIEDLVVRIAVVDYDSSIICEWVSALNGYRIAVAAGESQHDLSIGCLNLRVGTYRVNVTLTTRESIEILARIVDAEEFRVEEGVESLAPVQLMQSAVNKHTST